MRTIAIVLGWFFLVAGMIAMITLGFLAIVGLPVAAIGVALLAYGYTRSQPASRV